MAKLVVEIDAAQLDKAKQKAAQNLAKRVNIPGFRKGKAPYRILVNYVGEGAIIEDAVETLANDLYPEVVKASGIDPYGTGEVTNLNINAQPPTIEYQVALQPEVNLGDYRSVRVPYELPQADDDLLNRALKSLQEKEAIVEQSYRPVERGNRVTVDIHSFVVDGDHTHADDTTEATETDGDHDHEDGEHDHDHAHGEGDDFLHEHDFVMLLDDDGEPVPGFIDAITGMNVDEARTFDLVAPDKVEEYGESAGKTIHFEVTVKKIENITLPTLNDDFAARVTAEREKPLNLLEMRIEMRKSLQDSIDERYRNDYVMQVLDAIRAQATIHYPPAVIMEQINVFLNDLDERLHGQGLNLKEYLRLTNRTIEDVAGDYEPSAIRTVERGLLARTIGASEQIVVSQEAIQTYIGTLVARYSEDQRANAQTFFESKEMRDSIANDLLMSNLYDRIIAIAKGDELPLLASVEAAVADEQKGETA
jgi:trigger factor